jgi:hypothetical protein
MKKLLTVTLALVVFLALVDTGMGQVKGGEGKAVEKKAGPPSPPGPSPQRAVCEAKCRQDYQGNPAALEACYRRCGGPEATPVRQVGDQPPPVPTPRTYAPGDAHYGSTPKKEVSGIESETPVKAKSPVGVEMKQPATGGTVIDKSSPKPRIGVRDPGTPEDTKYIEAVAAACKDKKTGDIVRVGGKGVKCSAGIAVSDPGTPAEHIVCRSGDYAGWSGWSRCCSFYLSETMGWQISGCWWTQN